MLRERSFLRRPHAYLLGLVAAVLFVSCGDPLVAPDQSTIKVSASPTSISLNGTTTITATVTTPSGNAVADGTEVSFYTTFGNLGATQVHTRTGQAATELHGRGTAGTAFVVAASGAARSDPIQVAIGGVWSLTLEVSPTTVAALGTVTFTATPSASAPAITRYDWDFGDPDHPLINTKSTTTSTTTYNGYTSAATRTVTVTAVAADGSSAIARASVIVQ
ncbi:MAG: PKD domain-containing protein [Bacteroidales bacterium]